MQLTNPNFIIIVDPEEQFPYVIAPSRGSINNSRKVARKAMLDAGAKPFRFKPKDHFMKYANFTGEYEEHPCFYFDFTNKLHRKTISQIKGTIQ